MSLTMYRIFVAMRRAKKGMHKRTVQNLVAVPTKDFDEAWKRMRNRNLVLVTRRKTFVLNGTSLASRLSVEDRLAG